MTRNNSRLNAAANPYLVRQVSTASPQKLVLMLYDLGLKSCRANDKERAARVLVELISALDFDHRDVALPLFAQYRFALAEVQQQKFDYPTIMFQELRDVWESAVIGQSSQQPVFD